MDTLPETAILTSPRSKWVMSAIVFMLLAGMGVGLLVVGEESDTLLAWLAIGLFGAGALICVLLALMPSRLELYKDGFCRTTFGRQSRFKWNDVSEFTLSLIHI